MTDDGWTIKQIAAHPGRYYGDGGTIHGSGHLDVEVRDGVVVAVWFRCQQLPFVQHNVEPTRADSVGIDARHLPRITGVEVLDPGVIDS